MKTPKYPSLYQVNTRVWLSTLSRQLGRLATLDDIPESDLENWARMGFDWIWLLSVWQTGLAGQQISRSNVEWRREFQDTLGDLCDDDIAGSGFAITSYTVHRDMGGDAALARLRERLRKHGLRLMLDFVPNHTGLDHHWVEEHPEYYIRGTEVELARSPQNYVWVKRQGGNMLLACGRDPNFPGWPDSIQLNYGNSDTQAAMSAVLLNIAERCDGVRCDMAMLVLPDIFKRTWGLDADPFWPMAIQRVRGRHPEFLFMAEAYWDLEWTLQQEGFDYTYDKRLYDRLCADSAFAVRGHLQAGLEYQDKLARFLENHDEPRAAVAFFPGKHEAAATITFLSPGLRFFHQGQLQGFKKRISPHICRGPEEPVDRNLKQFYERLLAILQLPVVRAGTWHLIECAPAWRDNWTVDCFVAFAWEKDSGERLIVAVNYAANRSQCFLRLPYSEVAGHAWRFKDLFSDAIFERDGSDLQARGLYLDMPAWQFSVFEMKACSTAEVARGTSSASAELGRFS